MKFAFHAYSRQPYSFNKSFEEHVEHFCTVLQRLRAQGIKLKAKKCKLFHKEVTCFGQIVSAE